ncbi:MAG: PQQ-dependent sugar dehydrogenase [Gemmatimonadetes bacterium]|nr:PQQ-dependent sugar dehydrogenase [Gemmatimonadota bacterium]NIR76930.1 PQQ-dependent sugar dehydrogenase [Gemmatimonadota bacterium]NIT85461.1 PQQ-dependent sugar dehydrogenase [Gemmatimonadota bacterium]NIU29274.1 PQQ-dependent sugar dehydrogenase [Gemmatimonadota bacterium]NIU34355.1 PQQ-dependent sugar dehydrogenase [Gemmatimonadota bacterium]
MKKTLSRLTVVVAVALAVGLALNGIVRKAFLGPERPTGAEEGESRNDLTPEEVRVVASGLQVPWEIRFLPGGDLLVSERPGRLVRLTAEGRRVRSDPVADVAHTGEGGLMGLALHPDFASNRWIFLCFTTDAEGGLTNRVERYTYGEAGLSGRTAVLTGMAGARFHDGCRLEFGSDGFLYVTMGDAGNAEAAQSTSSLSGKILRITDSGAPAPGNPYGNRVWSYGHRNPQGMAFEPSGRLWSTEHGPSGFESGRDEVNLIVRGRNYGWPEVTGDESASGMVGPLAHSGGSTWAPAGAAWLDGSLYFGGLRGEALFQARIGRIDPSAARAIDVEIVPHFFGEWGRIRAVRVGPDGWIWFGTSNRDGRGRVRDGDDRIVRIDPGALR